jgi:hypothetical protein
MKTFPQAWKTLLLFFACAVISLILAGCGKGDEQPSAEHPSKTEHPSTEHPAKEQPAQEHPSGEHPSGEHPE